LSVGSLKWLLARTAGMHSARGLYGTVIRPPI